MLGMFDDDKRGTASMIVDMFSERQAIGAEKEMNDAENYELSQIMKTLLAAFELNDVDKAVQAMKAFISKCQGESYGSDPF